MIKNKVLIIGKIPPPAGGLGIHVERLIGMLKQDGIHFQFYDLRKLKLHSLLHYINNSQIIHIHVSNSYLRFILIIMSKVLMKKTIFTFHGNIGRYNWARNKIDMLSFLFANIGIVINNDSYLKVKSYKSSCIISAFIPPIEIKPLSLFINSKILSFRKNYKRIFCTNANGMTFDKYNREIYGIMGLIEIFRELPNFGLIISDASSAYYNYFKNNKIVIPPNIYILNDEHDFVNIILNSDAFIRATTTDGDSLSVKESLYFGKCTVCSDTVDREKGVILFETGNWIDLKNKLELIDNWKNATPPQSGYPLIKTLYYGK